MRADVALRLVGHRECLTAGGRQSAVEAEGEALSQPGQHPGGRGEPGGEAVPVGRILVRQQLGADTHLVHQAEGHPDRAQRFAGLVPGVLRLEPFAIGERLAIRTADGRQHHLQMTGITHEVAAAPAFYTGRIQAHVTPETLADLGVDDTFDELRILVDHHRA